MDLVQGLVDFKQDAAAARAKGLCVICGEEAAGHVHTEAGRREYEISGSCEDCFDKMFAEDEDEDEDEGGIFMGDGDGSAASS